LAKKMKVRCPRCGEEFEVSLPIMEVPEGQILLHEVTYQASPEAERLWEKRKKQLEH
jgi:C4-type Zn-finger protein